MRTPKRNSDPAHVSFRLANPALGAELASRADAVGTSPNLYARELVVAGLMDEDQQSYQLQQLSQQLLRLEQRVQTIQQTLLRGFAALLVHGCRWEPTAAQELMAQLWSEAATPVPEANHVQSQKNGAGI